VIYRLRVYADAIGIEAVHTRWTVVDSVLTATPSLNANQPKAPIA
jgi:hypothetical protein